MGAINSARPSSEYITIRSEPWPHVLSDIGLNDSKETIITAGGCPDFARLRPSSKRRRGRSGAGYQAHVDPHTLGSPDNPLPDARLRAKVIELLTLTLPTAKASDLVDRLRNLDGMSDVRRLPLLLSAENPPLAFS